MSDPRPACLVTSRVTDYRAGPFALLAEAEDVEVLAWDAADRAPDGPPVTATTQRGAVRRIGEGRYRAVVCGLGGRVALPGSFLAARRAGVPFVLWASIWAHPRTPFHALSAVPTAALYRRADAVVTYGPHVTRHVLRSRGARGNVFEAPQAVDNDHFSRPVEDGERLAMRERAGAAEDGFLALFVGRLEREKGVPELLEAFARADLGADAVLALAGEGPLSGLAAGAGPRVRALGHVPREELPALYAAADCLVLPSVRTATFTEPWGLVCNEGMNQGLPLIASDAVGAVAGGLASDGRNALVFPAGDVSALTRRLEALARSPELRERLGAAGRRDVHPFTYRAWVEGVQGALEAVRASRRPSC